MNISNIKIIRNHRKQRGIAVVEAAIVLPLVLFVMLVVAEFGHAILQYNRLTQSVRDGTRYIAAKVNDGGNLNLSTAKINATKNLVAYGTEGATTAALLPGLNAGIVDVTLVGRTVSVTAVYPYTPLFFPNIPGMGGAGDASIAFPLRAQVSMRVL